MLVIPCLTSAENVDTLEEREWVPTSHFPCVSKPWWLRRGARCKGFTLFPGSPLVSLYFHQHCLAIMSLAKGSKVGWAKFYQAEKALHESKNEIMEVLFPHRDFINHFN